jgi:hypothetical protein
MAGGSKKVWLLEAVMTVLGILLAAMPLALWFAWSKAVYYTVFGIGAAAFAMIYLLGRFGPPEPPAPAAKRRVPSQEFIDELHRLVGRSVP